MCSSTTVDYYFTRCCMFTLVHHQLWPKLQRRNETADVLSYILIHILYVLHEVYHTMEL